jgi:hypothetical protein
MPLGMAYVDDEQAGRNQVRGAWVVPRPGEGGLSCPLAMYGQPTYAYNIKSYLSMSPGLSLTQGFLIMA